MLRKKLVFILFGALLSFKSFSFEPHSIDTSEIFDQIKKIDLDQTRLSFSTTFFNSIVYKNDSTLFYNPQGTLLLFKIKLGVVTKVKLHLKRNSKKYITTHHTCNNYRELIKEIYKQKENYDYFFV